MENYFSNKSITGLLFKWKYHLAIITVIAAVLAVIFSGPTFITPLFKSFAVVYPSNVAPYSEESETEQMLQFLQSRDIKDSVIKKFNLSKHYGIDTSFNYYYSTILYEYDEHVSIKKTPYESAEIEVYDRNPDTARMIVEAIMDFYNKKVRRSQNDKWKEVIDIYKQQMKHKREYMDSLRQVMRELGTKYGLYEYESQSEEITRGLLGTADGINPAALNKNKINELNKAMEQKAGDLVSAFYMLKYESEAFASVRLEYEQAYRFYTDKLTHLNVVSAPYPADKKSYPVRWLIVVITVIATLFLSSLVVIVIENFKTYIPVVYRKRRNLKTKNHKA